MPHHKLTLPDEIFLLCLNDSTGRIDASYFGYALAGGVLADLLLSERITLDEDKVYLCRAEPLGNVALDIALRSIMQERKPRTLAYWVRRLAGDQAATRAAISDRLVGAGIVARVEGKSLWVFRNERFPTADPEPERLLRESLRHVIVSTGDPDVRAATLISLLNYADAIRLLLSGDEVRAHKQRIGEIAASYLIAQSVGKAVATVVSEDTATATAAIFVTTG